MVKETTKIAGGLVLDGTGAPAKKMDVLIAGDTTVSVGESIPEKGDTIIDAAGLHVVPGFIDMHGHSDLVIMGNPLCPEKILQGVTTDVVGNCGVSIAPSTEDSISLYGQVIVNVMGGDKTPPIPDHGKLFEKLAELGHSLNIAALVPQGNVRVSVMGVDTALAPKDKLDEMKAILDRCMAAGAFGMSTGLVYPPGSDTTTGELIELAKVLKGHGGFYASHIRNEMKGVIDAVKEALRIGREAGVGVEISHLKAAMNDRATPKLLATIQAARDAGADVTADMYPYIAGATSLGAIILPGWLLAKSGPELTRTMMDPATKKRVYDEALSNLLRFVKISPKFRHVIPRALVSFVIGLLAKRVIVTKVGVSKVGVAGKHLDEILKNDPGLATEKGLIDKTLAFLGREEGDVMICMFQEDEVKTLIPIMQAPFVMIGTDNIIGHPRTWGCYPQLIGTYVRDKGVLTIEEAIRKCTSLPASRLRLADRGLIRPGCKADIVTFDLATIKDNATYENWTLPPSGIKHVFVNGKLTAEDGVHLKVKAGVVLKNRR
ncbi:MAG: D-aminoacylase [Candidatus Lokiarchaeota archaeon]|nr:D-aminoacylase [Candidatus Lokiarchaeota archaeon]